MPRSTKHLLIGSLDSYSGKSTAVLGLAHSLQKHGLDIAYGKPVGTFINETPTGVGLCGLDADVGFLANTLNLGGDRLRPTLVMLNQDSLSQVMTEGSPRNYTPELQESMASHAVPLVLLEGPGTLEEGYLYGLSLHQMAEAIDAAIILVIRFHDLTSVDRLLVAKERLGNRLVGVILNDVPKPMMPQMTSLVQPFLESHGVPVVGLLPHSEILKSVSVGELVHRLNAKVLCAKERMDLMVETLFIGAMNVNSALEYFRQGHNMAIVTGGDRADLQLAALETSTQCLILTGHVNPSAQILARAEEMEIPILTVDLDTLSTVEIIEHAFAQVRLHDGSKREYVFRLSEDAFYIDRLLNLLQIPLPTLV